MKKKKKNTVEETFAKHSVSFVAGFLSMFCYCVIISFLYFTLILKLNYVSPMILCLVNNPFLFLLHFYSPIVIPFFILFFRISYVNPSFQYPIIPSVDVPILLNPQQLISSSFSFLFDFFCIFHFLFLC